MSRQRALFNKVTAVLEKQARNSATNLSFTVILDDSEPEVYRTRNWKPKPNDSSNSTPNPQSPKTQETQNESE